MALLTFKGGIHPDDGKRLAKDKAIVEVKPKGNLIYPLSQHIGAPASPIVAVGDHVKKGQKIGELRDLFGTVLEELAAPYDGINIYMVVSLAVSVGDPLISIGKL